MTHAIHMRREPLDDALPGPAQLEAWEDEGGAARAAADCTAQVLIDRPAAVVARRTHIVIQSNHTGERVRSLLSIGIATTAIIGLSWTYALTAPEVEQAATGVTSDKPESSSGLIAGGQRIFRSDTPDDEQPWTDTVRLLGVAEKRTLAFADCRQEGDVLPVAW